MAPEHPPSTHDIRGLIAFALDALQPMQLPSGLFCVERGPGDPEPRGSSLRYSAMVYLGLLKAGARGPDAGIDVARLGQALWERSTSPELRPGDLGLYLWAAARAGRALPDDPLSRLERALAAAGGPLHLEGQELSWMALGLLNHLAGTESAPGERLLRDVVDLLVGRGHSPSGLQYHVARRSLRRRLPNFATQIYAVLALSALARAGTDERALPTARRIADRLLALQQADGAWPWLYDAGRGRVVERYELYSVHQHAMAPMALAELTEVSGDPRYLDAAVAGLPWIHGANELERDMIDAENRLIYRSIRRNARWRYVYRFVNAAGVAAVGRTAPEPERTTTVNRITCSYELGWLLEAWCGREDALGR